MEEVYVKNYGDGGYGIVYKTPCNSYRVYDILPFGSPEVFEGAYNTLSEEIDAVNSFT